MPQHSKGTTQKNKITTTTTKTTYAKTNNQLKIKNDNKFNSVSSCGRNDFLTNYGNYGYGRAYGNYG